MKSIFFVLSLALSILATTASAKSAEKCDQLYISDQKESDCSLLSVLGA